jgi:ubiquinone/menaquinone biosynthesis C-methylase UbiE
MVARQWLGEHHAPVEVGTVAGALMTQYDEVAEAYEARVVPKFRAIAERLVGSADIRPGDAALEIAAGTGGLSRLVVRRLASTGSLVLSDISPGMLAVAERVVADAPPGEGGMPSIRTQVADLGALPFDDGSFDLVLGQMTPVLDSERGIAETFRVLRPSGRLALATWGATYQENRILNGARAVVGVEPYPRPELRQFAPRLRRAGYVDVHQRTQPMTVVHDDVRSYLAYRLGFGQVGWTQESVDAYLAALSTAAAAATSRDGRLRLGWSITIVTAVKPIRSTESSSPGRGG